MLQARRVCLAAVLGFPLAVLRAQETLPLATGSRVRVIRPDPGCGAPGAFWCKRWSSVGALVSIDSQIVIVRDGSGLNVRIPRVIGMELDLSTGPGLCGSRHRSRCVTGGLVGGAVLGTVAGAIWQHSHRTSCAKNCGLAYLVSVPVGAAAGALIGEVLGREHWSETAMPVHLSLARGRQGRSTLGLSMTF